ncbi:MAG TPA: YihY/virulence factor BrkB family protein [Terriglobales bacterium]|jgi:membrane protein|nr:YihY/virulence factor BrkB family protein [Terriglobales bacterium]
MLRFLRLLNASLWRAFEHDAFMLAKAAAYSSILTLFPGLLVIAAVLATSHTTEAFVREVAYAVGRILPPGSHSTAMSYFEGHQRQPVRILVSASLITLLAASGIMISWMQGFRAAYELPKTWGFWKERFIAILLVLLSVVPMTAASIMVAFGNQIETWMVLHAIRTFGDVRFYILLFWSGVRWIIATLTSIAVMTIIYHAGVPRSQPWHRVLGGATLATLLWLLATFGFGWYVRRFATYNLIYGSLGAAIALLVWMYMTSIIVLVGAEFNALCYPHPRKLNAAAK